MYTLNLNISCSTCRKTVRIKSIQFARVNYAVQQCSLQRVICTWEYDTVLDGTTYMRIDSCSLHCVMFHNLPYYVSETTSRIPSVFAILILSAVFQLSYPIRVCMSKKLVLKFVTDGLYFWMPTLCFLRLSVSSNWYTNSLWLTPRANTSHYLNYSP